MGEGCSGLSFGAPSPPSSCSGPPRLPLPTPSPPSWFLEHLLSSGLHPSKTSFPMVLCGGACLPAAEALTRYFVFLCSRAASAGCVFSPEHAGFCVS